MEASPSFSSVSNLPLPPKTSTGLRQRSRAHTSGVDGPPASPSATAMSTTTMTTTKMTRRATDPAFDQTAAAGADRSTSGGAKSAAASSGSATRHSYAEGDFRSPETWSLGSAGSRDGKVRKVWRIFVGVGEREGNS